MHRLALLEPGQGNKIGPRAARPGAHCLAERRQRGFGMEHREQVLPLIQPRCELGLLPVNRDAARCGLAIQ